MNPNSDGGQPFGVEPQRPYDPTQSFQPQPMQAAPSMPPYQPAQSPSNPTQPSGVFAPQPVTQKPSKIPTILMIVFIITTVIGAGVSVWALINYFDQKDNVDSKVSSAVATAVKKQADDDAANFLNQEKQPNRQFAGPDDYGHLAFDYPKTWSVYVNKDASTGGTYEAYLSPVVVPPVAASTRYALRVTIEEKDYDKVLDTYKQVVAKGDLKSTVFKLNDTTTGTRLDGNFTKDIRGSALVFKIRDKTVTLRTDAETFKADFDALIGTITFNQ